MKLEVPPLCERGRHMMMRLKDKQWHCYVCESLDKSNKPKSTCLNYGHLKLRGEGTKCGQCEALKKRPELLEFYRTGSAQCQYGHEMTVETVTWARMVRCGECAKISARKGWEGKRVAAGQPLDRTDIDWVRVLQYLSAMGCSRSRASGDNYELVPFAHLSNGERWVIACTGSQDRNSADDRLLEEWRQLGAKHGWKHLTLFDILSSLHSEEYSEGRLLESPLSTG